MMLECWQTSSNLCDRLSLQALVVLTNAKTDAERGRGEPKNAQAHTRVAALERPSDGVHEGYTQARAGAVPVGPVDIAAVEAQHAPPLALQHRSG
jgi:hypothetical protein